MFNIQKWTLPLEIVLAWSDEKWVFSKNIRKVWQTEHVNKPGNKNEYAQQFDIMIEYISWLKQL